MPQVAGGCDNEIIWDKDGAVIICRDLARKALDGLGRSRDREAQRMAGKECLTEYLTEILVRRVLEHLHLLDDHTLLAPQIRSVKAGIKEHIRDQVKGPRQLIVDDLDGKAGFLMRGKCIEIAAQTVLLDRNIERCAARRSLEHSVFDKVRNAIQLNRLVPRPGTVKEPEGRTSHTGHAVGEDHHAVIEPCFLYLFLHAVTSELRI